MCFNGFSGNEGLGINGFIVGNDFSGMRLGDNCFSGENSGVIVL